MVLNDAAESSFFKLWVAKHELIFCTVKSRKLGISIMIGKKFGVNNLI